MRYRSSEDVFIRTGQGIEERVLREFIAAADNLRKQLGAIPGSEQGDRKDACTAYDRARNRIGD